MPTPVHKTQSNFETSSQAVPVVLASYCCWHHFSFGDDNSMHWSEATCLDDTAVDGRLEFEPTLSRLLPSPK